MLTDDTRDDNTKIMKKVGEAHRFSSLPLHLDELGRTQESEPNFCVLQPFHPPRATLVYFLLSKQICKNISYVERYRMHDCIAEICR